MAVAPSPRVSDTCRIASAQGSHRKASTRSTRTYPATAWRAACDICGWHADRYPYREAGDAARDHGQDCEDASTNVELKPEPRAVEPPLSTPIDETPGGLLAGGSALRRRWSVYAARKGNTPLVSIVPLGRSSFGPVGGDVDAQLWG